MAEHRIAIAPTDKRVRVVYQGKTIADTLRPMLLVESDAMPVYYFPREDVVLDRLEHTNHRTQCSA
jgi:uncharacterized protein (DUF427 family)